MIKVVAIMTVMMKMMKTTTLVIIIIIIIINVITTRVRIQKLFNTVFAPVHVYTAKLF